MLSAFASNPLPKCFSNITCKTIKTDVITKYQTLATIRMRAKRGSGPTASLVPQALENPSKDSDRKRSNKS